MRDAISESPNVPLIKDFLGKFMKDVGSDPFDYFVGHVKQLMLKSEVVIRESKEVGGQFEYYIGFKNGLNGKVVIDRDCQWHIEVYKTTGSLYKEHKGKSFSLLPLRDFFSRMSKDNVG